MKKQNVKKFSLLLIVIFILMFTGLLGLKFNKSSAQTEDKTFKKECNQQTEKGANCSSDARIPGNPKTPNPTVTPFSPTLPTELLGNVSDSGNQHQSACVVDVEASYENLRVRGDIMGYQINMGDNTTGGPSIPDPTQSQHWQGMQRLTVDNKQFLVVSRDRDDNLGGLAFVELESRDDSNGGRFRSNRIDSNKDFNETPPPVEDRVIGYINTVSPVTGVSWEHPGGMQASGKTLAVPVENSIGSSLKSEVYFYDVSDPTNPVAHSYGIKSFYDAAAAVAMAQLNDGSYIIAVNTGDNKPVDFFISKAGSLPGELPNKIDFADRWRPNELMPNGAGDWGRQENLQFITQCDGKLYLLGTFNDGSWPNTHGSDMMKLYSVDSNTAGGTKVKITYVGRKDVYCSFDGKHNCNLKTAAGVYVTSNNKMILYATEHDNDGPEDNDDEGTVKMMEFAEYEECSTSQESWVHLFRHGYFSGDTMFIDYVDKSLKPYDKYNDLGDPDMNDEISSVRWCLPVGQSYRLYKHSEYNGSIRNLVGTGQMESIGHFNQIGFNDQVSSSKFIP